MKNKRPVNLSLGQVLSVNMSSPVAMASIAHRMSGILVFLLIPVVLCLLQGSLASEESFLHVKNDIFGSVWVKLLMWVFLSGMLFHFFAGVKHLLADIGFAESLEGGRLAAWVAIGCSAVTILAAFVWVVL